MKNFKSLSRLIPLAPFLMMCVPIPVPAQRADPMAGILVITGASSEEELDEQEVERFNHYLSHPLEINLASRSRLVSSGLLSQYQAASLLDYRSRFGDVLSFSELSAIEGFGPENVAALKPFLSLASRSLPGAVADSLEIRQDALARVAAKGDAFSYGAKYKIAVGEYAEASLAARSYYQDKSQFPPSSWAANITCYGNKLLGKAVIGDYNLRVGQGLSLWSGMSLSGLSSSTSFSRRPTGLSPSWSWSGIGSHRGIAADFQKGRVSMIAFMSLPGLRNRMEGDNRKEVTLMPGVVLGWLGKNGQVSFSAWKGSTSGKISGDFRYNLFGVDMFGETSYDVHSKTIAAVAGTSILIGEGWRLSGVARSYPGSFDSSFTGSVRSWTKTSDERGVALGLEHYGAQLTADLAGKHSDRSRRQLKMFLKVPAQVTQNAVLTVRLTERYRPYEETLKYKTGGRVDLDWSSAGISARYGDSDGDAWRARARLEGTLCRGLAGLTYYEFGRKTSKWHAYLRGTMFLVDNWDDRIYSYERDAPGNFTVPAYYGRGFAFSAVGGYKFRFMIKKTLRVYLRVSDVAYPLMKDPKPSVWEAKLQAVLAL